MVYIYTAIALNITGALTLLYGAIWYMHKIKSTPDLAEYRIRLRAKFMRYKMAFFVSLLLSALILTLPSLVD